MRWNNNNNNITLFALIVVVLCVAVRVEGYGEPDGSGHPNWLERANHVFVNAVRIAPSQYKTVYMAGYSPSAANILGSTYPAQPPLYLEPKLVSSAYAHSLDMGLHGCYQHDSCDGTPTFTRVKAYYPCSGTLGENIAWGNADPLDSNNQLLCDSTNGACAADGSSSDGHRSNIMSRNYKAFGIGYYYNASDPRNYHHFWTSDFGGAVCSPAPTSPVYGASHRVKAGQNKFIAVYYTSPAVAPASANVVISGTSYALSLDIGASGAGTYAFTQTAGTACRPYYFQFGSIRYPETGCLVTYGEGSCTTSFDATCGGSNTATTATTAATVATATTATTAATVATATTAATVATATTGTATTTTGTVTPRPTTTPTPRPTPTPTTSGGVYYLYSTALQNSWTMVYNSGVTVTNSYTYSGKTGLSITLANSGSNTFFWFQHSPAVNNVWTSLQFNAAASTNAKVIVYFNGGYYQTKSLTTAWQPITIPLSSLGNPNTHAPYATLNQLVFQNTGSSTATVYLNNVAFI